MSRSSFSINRLVLVLVLAGGVGLAWLLTCIVRGTTPPRFVIWFMVPLPVFGVLLLVTVLFLNWRARRRGSNGSERER